MKFDWDTSKAKCSYKKHKVSFEEAASVFFDPNAIEVFDAAHSTESEDRVIRIGLSAYTRVLLVVYTERVQDGEEITRIINARKANKEEKEAYFRGR